MKTLKLDIIKERNQLFAQKKKELHAGNGLENVQMSLRLEFEEKALESIGFLMIFR